MRVEIRYRGRGAVMHAGEYSSVADAVVDAVRNGVRLIGANLVGANLVGANLRGADLGDANLRGADLGSANLRGADLGSANLHGANLRGANLVGANLRGANLVGANLRGAYLHGANLRGADLRGPGETSINWSSHDLISEILWCAADTEPRAMLAAFVGRRRDWCWGEWERWEHPEKAWALAELVQWVHRDDEYVPDLVRDAGRRSNQGGRSC